MVSWLSIAFMIMDMILGVVIPLGLMLYFKRKYQLSVMPFWVGCLTMVVFAMVLEQIVHYLFLQSPIGVTVQNNALLIALYGGLMAGIFEECGRFAAMKFVLKKKQDNPHNALMYGAGHGGVEMFLILVMGMINNVIYSIMINLDQTKMLLEPLDQANKTVLQNAFDTLIAISPFTFLISPMERIFALTAQVALSVIVWFAVVKKNKKILLLAAIFLHFFLDASAAWLAKKGIPTLAIEGVVFLVVCFIVWCARIVWKKEQEGI